MTTLKKQKNRQILREMPVIEIKTTELFEVSDYNVPNIDIRKDKIHTLFEVKGNVWSGLLDE